MGEVPISPKALEDAMPEALPSLFPNLLGTSSSARSEFYDKFRCITEEYDREFIRKCDQDLSTTLIFAGLLSGVASTFILDAQHNLQPDFQEMTYDLLKIIAINITSGQAPNSSVAAFPQWSGPNHTAVHIQSVLYSSLATSLFAAFIAMLGKQWLDRYARVKTRGSAIDRSRRRQRKVNAMIAWNFDIVMGCLPFMLQIALLLLGYALSNRLFFINKVVAGVLIGFTSFGLFFHLLITFIATFFRNCPFQTPPSLILRSLIRFYNDRRKHSERSASGRWLKRFLSRKKEQPGRLGVPSHHIEVTVVERRGSPAVEQLFSQRTDGPGCVLDSNCIALMFEMSMDANVIMAIMRFIPEVIWHAGIRKIPLEPLYDTVVECLDRSSGHLVVIPEFRSKAYLSAKAFLHLTIQHKCIAHKNDREVFGCISERYSPMNLVHCGDLDLESTLGIMDREILGHDLGAMDWKNLPLSLPHHAWMGHILLYSAWYVREEGRYLPDHIKGFVHYSLRLELPPSAAPLTTDCLFIIGLFLGIRLNAKDLFVVDKSQKHTVQIGRIFDKLEEAFRSISSTREEIDIALEVMELIAPLSEDAITQRSHDLFHVVMRTPVSPAYSEEKKWEALQLTMDCANKCNKSLPCVENPEDILASLVCDFNLAASKNRNRDEPTPDELTPGEPTPDEELTPDEAIGNALRALHASGPVAVEALKRFNPTEAFISGILYVFQDDKPSQLRRAALLFLPFIGNGWFNTLTPIMRDDQMRKFCADWASAVDDLEHTHHVRKAALAVLYDMIKSCHWRPHIVTEKLKITGLLEILWLEYEKLIPPVGKQLTMVTKWVTQGRGTDFDKYLSAIDSELKKAKDALAQCNKWPTDPAAVALRKRIENLQQDRDALAVPQGG